MKNKRRNHTAQFVQGVLNHVGSNAKTGIIPTSAYHGIWPKRKAYPNAIELKQRHTFLSTFYPTIHNLVSFK